MRASRPSVRLIVLGVRDRGDDAAALEAVSRLPDSLLARCEIRRSGGLDILELVDLPADGACVIADAALGLAPGGVLSLELDRLLAADTALPVPRSSHELPIGHVLQLAALMRGAVPAGRAVVIGGERFGLGEGLSSRVVAGLPAFADALGEAIRECS